MYSYFLPTLLERLYGIAEINVLLPTHTTHHYFLPSPMPFSFQRRATTNVLHVTHAVAVSAHSGTTVTTILSSLIGLTANSSSWLTSLGITTVTLV